MDLYGIAKGGEVSGTNHWKEYCHGVGKATHLLGTCNGQTQRQVIVGIMVDSCIRVVMRLFT